MAPFVMLIYRDCGNRFLLGIPGRERGSGEPWARALVRGRWGHPGHRVLLLGLCQNIQIFAKEGWMLLSQPLEPREGRCWWGVGLRQEKVWGSPPTAAV